MPQVTVYVREEDLPKWKALEKKSEFIHQALNKTYGDAVSEVQAAKKVLIKNLEKNPDYDVANEPFVPRPPDPETGYPCCLNERKPCKHWTFDGNQAVWVNSLTGKTREVL